MKAIIKKSNKDEYVSKIQHSEYGGVSVEFTTKVSDALIYSSKGVAIEITRYIPHTEVVSLHSVSTPNKNR